MLPVHRKKVVQHNIYTSLTKRSSKASMKLSWGFKLLSLIHFFADEADGFVSNHPRPSFSKTFAIPRTKGAVRTYSSKSDGEEGLRQLELSMKHLFAGFIVSVAINLSPIVVPNHVDWFAAYADDSQVSIPSNVEESLLTAPSSSNNEQKNDLSVVEEAWTLIDKYFIDQTFNGQNWKEVKKQYLQQEGLNPPNEKSMQLVTKMTKTLGDKYSRILDAKAYEAIQKYDLIGVGATLMPNAHKMIIVGAPPVPGSAADQAGMKVGDYISAVNGIPTEGRTAFDIIDQISENPNSKTITMTVRTQGTNDLTGEGRTRDLVLDRNVAEVRDPIEYRISETRKDGTKVGYIRIAEFNSVVKARLEDAIEKLEQQGANAYVLDLRGNPGGAFQSAVEISSLFIDDRVATYVVDSNQVELPFKTAKGRVIVDPQDPIVIWVDRNSASASEVLTGSLHDNCRAVVMGENSFGKGKVQAVYGLKNGAGLVLTVAKYITPSGTDIQGSGVTPDIEIGLPPSLVPFISGDTSKVDFRDISNRLSMCQAPTSH